MNDNKENMFGSLEDLQPIDQPIEEQTQSTTTDSTPSFTEIKPTNDEYSFTDGFDFGTTTETPVTPSFTSQVETVVEPVTPLDPVVPLEPMTEDVDTNSAPLDQPITESYTEIPVASVTENQPEKPIEMIEHPDAKVTLHREINQDLPEIKEPTEKVDKSTIWLLVGLFVGLMAVILALPYLSQLF